MAQNDKAVAVAYSWLSSWGLDVKAENVDSESKETEISLVVNGLRVAIGAGENSANSDMTLNAKNLNSRDIKDALAECYRVTERLGMTAPASGRGANLTVLRASTTDFEAASMRLTPYSRSANPTPEDMTRYYPIVKREVDCAAVRYYSLLRQAQMERDDLLTVGLIFFCVFLHRYRVLRDEAQNGPLLTQFLRQEFRRWAHVTYDNLQRTSFAVKDLPACETVGIARGCTPHPTQQAYTWAPEALEADPDSDAPADLELPPEIARKIHEKEALVAARVQGSRKRAAHAELEDRLESLGHDRMIEALRSAADSAITPKDARCEARRRLTVHAKTCPICQSTKKNTSLR